MPNLKAYTFIVLILFLSACSNSIQYPDGGYDYPKRVADKDTDFYYYPVKDIMSKGDSLSLTVTYLLYKQYDEPNLSLHPMQHDVFRLQYNCALGMFYLITLTKDSIVIKKRLPNNHMIFDETRLTPEENNVKDFIYYNYPYDTLDRYKSKYRKMFYDSLMALDPKLLQPEHFIYLIKKTTNYLPSTEEYTRRTVRLSEKDYTHLLETINQSGYWKMPYEFDCENAMLDGCGYSLEANTNKQYNLVNSGNCDDTLQSAVKFAKTCQEIIKFAHLEKEISTWSGSMYKMETQDVQLPDIHEPSPKHKNKKHHQPNKEQKVQGSDTTKLN